MPIETREAGASTQGSPGKRRSGGGEIGETREGDEEAFEDGRRGHAELEPPRVEEEEGLEGVGFRAATGVSVHTRRRQRSLRDERASEGRRHRGLEGKRRRDRRSQQRQDKKKAYPDAIRLGGSRKGQGATRKERLEILRVEGMGPLSLGGDGSHRRPLRGVGGGGGWEACPCLESVKFTQ